MSGEIDEATAKIVDAVWHHFLVERLKPYIESGEYKKKRTALAPASKAPAGDTQSGITGYPPIGKGRITDFAFLAGRWTGVLGEGTAEETCTDASNHVMTCMIRYVEGGNVTELEFVSLREVQIAAVGWEIVERVRFFLADLSEKPGDEGITLALASVSPGEIVFDNVKTDGAVKHLRIIRNGTDEFTTRLDLVGADGKPAVREAKWKRAK
jgi:hypothetical protein